MTTVFSSDVRDLLSRYHRDVLTLRARLGGESSAASTSIYKPRTSQINIGAARMDACENLKMALKKLEDTFMRNVQNKLQSEREMELKQLETDFEEEIWSLTSQYNHQNTTTYEGAVSALGVVQIENTSTTSKPPTQFGSKMSLLPLKPDSKFKLTSAVKKMSTATTVAASSISSSSASRAADSTRTTAAGAPHEKRAGRLCNTARDALNHAKRLSIVGSYAESAAAYRHAGKIQDAYTFRNSLSKNPRLHFGDTTSIGQLRNSEQRLINASQRDVLQSEIVEKHLQEAIEEVRKRYQNAQERLRHRHTVEQHASVSLAQLAMSAPAEEKHCSDIQRKLQKKNSANNLSFISQKQHVYDDGGYVSDPDEMNAPYGIGEHGGYRTPSAAKRRPLSPSAPLLHAASLSPVTTSRPPSALTRDMFGRTRQHQRPQTPGSESFNFNSRPPTASGRFTATRSSPSRARSPFALNLLAVHTAGHHAAVVATSGSVLDGVAAPPPFGTRPPSSKVASGTTAPTSTITSRRLLLPRPQSAGGGGSVGGLSRPQTAHARLGLPPPPTPASSLVALCDAYGDLFEDEDDDNINSDAAGGEECADVVGECSAISTHRQGVPTTRARSATPNSTIVQGGTGARHNPRVNVTGTRYLQAVASKNRLHNNITPISIAMYE